MAVLTSSRRTIQLARSWPVLMLGLALGTGLLLLVMLASIGFGAADIGPADVWAALFAFVPGSTDHLIIRTLRVPRALVGALVGAALAVAGALMQGLTRNPLADTGILGIESGAALAVVGAVFFLKVGSPYYALFASAGAALTAGAVYALGSMGRGGPTPLRITVAGAAVTALLSSLTTGMLLLNQRTLEEVRFWLAGSVAGRDLSLLMQAAPYLLAGLVLARVLGRRITTLSLGDDVALRYSTYTWHAPGQSGEAESMEVRFVRGHFAALADDLAAAHPDVILLSSAHALRDWLREALEQHMAALIDAVHIITRLGKRAQWNLVADSCARLFQHAGQHLGEEPRGCAEGLAFIQSPASPMRASHTRYLTLECNGHHDTFVERGGCCLYYRVEPGHNCSTCPLRPAEERTKLLLDYMAETYKEIPA